MNRSKNRSRIEFIRMDSRSRNKKAVILGKSILHGNSKLIVDRLAYKKL